MENRFLSRGKRIDNGEWIFGNLIRTDDGVYIIQNYVPQHLIKNYEVDQSTVCQCTGLNDKNGKLIWENDVVKINNSKVNTLITFRDFEIICTIPNEKYYKHRLEYDTEYEVIGNIFDNPELLESEG